MITFMMIIGASFAAWAFTYKRLKAKHSEEIAVLWRHFYDDLAKTNHHEKKPSDIENNFRCSEYFLESTSKDSKCDSGEEEIDNGDYSYPEV